MKHCSKFNLILLVLSVFISNHKVSQAAEDGLLLGVPTTVNASLQSGSSEQTPAKQDDDKQNLINTKEENSVKEIHSSFDDAPMSHDETKNKDVLQSEPTTLQFQYQHVNIATDRLMVCSNTLGLPDLHLPHMGVFYIALILFTWSTYVRLSESGHAAVVYTLVDTVTSELQKQAASVSAEPENSTGPVTIPLTLSDAPSNDTQYIVRAEPRQESTPPSPPTVQENEAEIVAAVVGPGTDSVEEINDTMSVLQPQEPPPTHQEDIPSFSEWAQKQLAEAEKKKGENVTGGSFGNNVGLKVRHSKNYASPDCGAKVVGSNPEAVSAGAVLSSSRDEYLLNTCNARTWFIVELCEAIQPKKIEMANFELFSSSPKEFSIFLSDRYPTRDWALAGRFTAQDERNLQAFNLSDTAHFGKYVKVEVHSHYGQEHYCPISLLRVYGTSEIEVLDTVDEGEGHHSQELGVDDDDDEVPAGEKGEEPRNLFGSARDAVLSIVKKAAEALAKTPEEAKSNGTTVVQLGVSLGVVEPCVTPSHIVVCVNCSDDFYHRVYELMSCRSQLLSQLLSSEFVKQTMTSSELCAERGLDLRVGAPYPPSPRSLHARPRPIHYLQALLPGETLAALCNQLAVAQKKVVLNISYEQPADAENQTVLTTTPTVTEEPVVLPDPASCPVESNVSEEKLATRLPYEPAHSTSLPIRPSRTVRVEEPVVLSPTVVEEVEVNTAMEHVRVEVEVSQPVDDSSSNNPVNGSGSAAVLGTATTENLTLAVEDVVSLDSLFSELEQAVVPSPRVPPVPQKESVFVRLANRIKALERNMSLSGQYLEELSRRYKRQVEEMQKALVGAGEERRRWEERDSLRLEQVSQLAQQVETLTHAVQGLLEERDSWQSKTTVMTQHGLMVVVEVLVFSVMLYLCRWLPDMQVAQRRISVAWSRNKNTQEQARRRSVDQALPPAPSKKRRPSEEALVIAGNTHQELLIPDARRKISKGETRRQRRKRRRELIQPNERVREEKPSLLDRNSTESVKPWWEEEAFVPATSAPPPVLVRTEVVTAPRFVQTAVAQRQDRIAPVRSSSEASDKENKTFLPIKKTGPLKKIVKKFF